MAKMIMKFEWNCVNYVPIFKNARNFTDNGKILA